jgi:lycopene cyclase domain-containing protein
MSEYLILDLIIFLGPFLASFDKKVRFIQYWFSVLVSITIVGAVYLAWDAWATSRGHWAFNSIFVHDFRFLGLPMEEILFFCVVPYAGLFIWKTIEYYRRDRENELNFVPIRSAVLLAGVGIAMWVGKGYEYTALAAWSLALFLFADHWLKVRLTSQPSYWYTQLAIVFATLIFNGYLTARPIVLYGSQFQLGLRIYTIPVEDFLYGFGLCSWVMLVFSLMQGVGSNRG